MESLAASLSWIVVARLKDASGHRVDLTLDIAVDPTGIHLTGDANATAIGQGND